MPAGGDGGESSAAQGRERLVDVGGYRLAASVSGHGSPPTVLVSGLAADTSQWQDVIAPLSRLTAVVAYARPGLSGSDPLPVGLRQVPRTAGWAAEQLHELLAELAVPSPRVLVGHSAGGLIVEAYAARWPEDTAGLVLVDPSFPPLDRELTNPRPVHIDAEDGMRFTWLSWQPLPAPPVPAVVVTSAVGRWLELAGDETAEDYRPFTLAEMDRLWQSWQQDWAERLDAVQLIAHTGSHAVHQTTPDLVTLAAAAVVTAAREGRRAAHLDPAAVEAAGGALANR